jgi:hypothetical protein
LSIKRIWPEFKNLDYVADYFPDYTDSQLPERDFFYNVLSTLFPDKMKDLIAAARSNRASSNDPDKDELIEIDPVLKDNIISILSMPSK